MIITNIQIQAPVKKLTPREKEVLTLAAQGKLRPEIAALLKISENAVKIYSSRACHKLNATNKAQAAVIAVTLQLIAPYNLSPLQKKKTTFVTRTGNAPNKNNQVLARRRSHKKEGGAI
jgi:DNA-binding CsgD family transcriptional regulator